MYKLMRVMNSKNLQGNTFLLICTILALFLFSREMKIEFYKILVGKPEGKL